MVLDDGREWNRSHMPAELEALLNDPRVQALPENPPGFPRARILLPPENPPRPGESRYMRCYVENRESGGEPVWVNKPKDLVSLFNATGDGLGFAAISERPMIKEKARRPKRVQDIHPYLGWYVASPKAVELLRTFEPDIIETLEVDWGYSDGAKREGAVFLDICRCIPALDYRNCEVVFEKRDGKSVFWGMGAKLALKHDIDPTFHIVRDDYKRNFIFVTREFARAWNGAKLTGLAFVGLAGFEML
jgi:hypothetical protein